MPRAYADLVDLIEQKLQDTSNAEFTAAMINYQLEECLKELSNKAPLIIPVIFNIESRSGQATSTSASNLVDATKSQFLSSDPTNEKVVYNATDHTWATITSFSSTSQVGLSKDIFASGDTYYIFNKRCRNNRQLYIGDSFDAFQALRGEYPCNAWPRRWRNVRVIERDVIELDIDFEPDDSNSTLANLGRTEVLVEFKRAHILNQLVDLAGEVDLVAGYSAGDTAMVVDGLGDTVTIEEGELFNIENHRTLYTVTADVTTSGNEATISFYPGLEAAVSNNDDVTFVKSTLSPTLEELLAELTTARLMINQAPKYFKTIGPGGATMWRTLLDMGERKLAETLTRLNRDVPRITKRSYSAG